jgi:hypothetical protein
MINIDLSKVLHPKTFEFSAPLMPGLFFEISVMLSGRYTLWNISGRAQFGYFTTLGNRAFSCVRHRLCRFAVGSAYSMGDGLAVLQAGRRTERETNTNATFA